MICCAFKLCNLTSIKYLTFKPWNIVFIIFEFSFKIASWKNIFSHIFFFEFSSKFSSHEEFSNPQMFVYNTQEGNFHFQYSFSCRQQHIVIKKFLAYFRAVVVFFIEQFSYWELNVKEELSCEFSVRMCEIDTRIK